LAIVDGDVVGSRQVEYNEVNRTRMRTRARRTRMAKLIVKAKILQAVLLKKIAVPSLINVLIS
jgi:hypothetical protein